MLASQHKINHTKASTHLFVHPQPAPSVGGHLERQVTPQDVVREVGPPPVSADARAAPQPRKQRRPDVGHAPQQRGRGGAAAAGALYPGPSRLVARGERVHEREDLRGPRDVGGCNTVGCEK